MMKKIKGLFQREEEKLPFSRESFEFLLENNKGFRDPFYNFLESVYALENLLFFEAIWEYKRIPNDTPKQLEVANIINEKFIKPNSLYETMGESGLKNTIRNNVLSGNVDEETFNELEDQIMETVFHSTLPMFFKQPKTPKEKFFLS